MRIAWLLVLLAGCSGPTGPVAPDGPIVDGGDPLPSPMRIADGGDMRQGVDRAWNWSMEDRAVHVTARVTALGPGAGGYHVTQITDATVQVLHNGTVHTAGGVSGLRGSISPTPVVVFAWEESEPAGLWLGGEWLLRLRSPAQQADYAIEITVDYE